MSDLSPYAQKIMDTPETQSHTIEPIALSMSPDSAGDRTTRYAQTLWAELQLECEAMARHALLHGLAVPCEAIAQLADMSRACVALNTQSSTVPMSASARQPQIPLAQSLAAIHQVLVHAVAPATPQGILLLESANLTGQRYTWLGPVPLIRRLTLLAIGFLIAVVLTAMSPDVSSVNINRSLLDSSGLVLLSNTFFLLFCAGLGASFSALFHAYRYVADSNYDPKFDASYGGRMILGLIAGLIMVEMLPDRMFSTGSMHDFGKPALAMLGGFSAKVIHLLLHRMVETIEALIQGGSTPASPVKHARVGTVNEGSGPASGRAASQAPTQTANHSPANPEPPTASEVDPV